MHNLCHILDLMLRVFQRTIVFQLWMDIIFVCYFAGSWELRENCLYLSHLLQPNKQKYAL